MSTPTTLAEAIQAAWAADTGPGGNAALSLPTLLPASRCFIGKVPPADDSGETDTGQEMPYVRVEIPEGKHGNRSNVNLYAEQPVVFHVWTDGFDQGDQIGQQIERVFSFTLNWGTGGTLDSRFEPHSTTQQDTPEILQFETVCKFTMNTWQARTDTQTSSSSGS